jgi:hypothetical protein
MPESVRLSDLLPDRLGEVGEQTRRAICENEEISRMSLAWNYVGSQLEAALRTALDCDALGVLAKGWSGLQQLAEYGDPIKHPAGERSVVELGAHEVSREMHPVIAVTIGSCPCIELKFTFTVSGHFGGVKLTINDGHIVGGALGDSWASGQLSFNGVPLHQAAESSRVALPGEFALAAPGVAIPRLA